MMGLENAAKLEDILQRTDAIDANFADQHRDAAKRLHRFFLFSFLPKVPARRIKIGEGGGRHGSGKSAPHLVDHRAPVHSSENSQLVRTLFAQRCHTKKWLPGLIFDIAERRYCFIHLDERWNGHVPDGLYEQREVG